MSVTTTVTTRRERAVECLIELEGVDYDYFGQDEGNRSDNRPGSGEYGEDRSPSAKPSMKSEGHTTTEAVVTPTEPGVPPKPAERARALSNVNLSVAEGECVLLVGASGSGKSACLRTMNTLVPRFYGGKLSGSIRILSREGQSMTLADQAGVSAMVFQNPRTQFFTSTARAEMALVGEMLGESPESIRRSVENAAREAGIEHLLDRPLEALSGGQLQRVACACALAAHAPILLLDEPTSNLSPQAVRELADLLRMLKSRGITIVVAEHRVHLMRNIADRVVRLEDGRVVAEYSSEEFFALPERTRHELGIRSLTEPVLPDVPRVVPEPVASEPVDRVESSSNVGNSSNENPVSENLGTGEGNAEARPGLLIENLRFSYGGRDGTYRLRALARSFAKRLHARRGRPSERTTDNAGAELLNIASLDFPAGRVTAVCGPNGVGKSTLARIICGLHDVPGARISVNGKPHSAAERTRTCGLVMQDPRQQLFAATVAAEALPTGAVTEDDRKRARQALDSMGLLHLASRHPAALSGGQQQRLMIASSVVARRSVMIFDEPTSGVDAAHLHSIAEQMRLLAERGMTVICITHDAELVEACADRVVFLGEDPSVARAAEEPRCRVPGRNV